MGTDSPSIFYCILCTHKAFVSYIPFCAVASYFRCCTLNTDYSDVHDTNVCDGLTDPSYDKHQDAL